MPRMKRGMATATFKMLGYFGRERAGCDQSRGAGRLARTSNNTPARVIGVHAVCAGKPGKRGKRVAVNVAKRQGNTDRHRSVPQPMSADHLCG